MRDSAGRKQTRKGRGQPQSGRRSSSPPPAKQMRVLDTQQKPSERGASPEEKRPTEREKGHCGPEPGDRRPGAQELGSSTQGWGFLGRCSGKDKREEDHLGSRSERSGMQAGQGGKQRCSGITEEGEQVPGRATQGGAAESGTRGPRHGHGDSGRGRGRKSLQMRGQSIAEDTNHILEPKQARREIASCHGHQ